MDEVDYIKIPSANYNSHKLFIYFIYLYAVHIIFFSYSIKKKKMHKNAYYILK